MMKIAIIGNSHVGALKLGSDRCSQDLDGVELSFVGAAGQHIMNTRVEDGILLPTATLTEKHLRLTYGQASVDLKPFDALVVVGLAFSTTILSNVYRGWRTAAMRPNPAGHLVSEACFRQAVTDAISASPAVQLARMLRSGTSAPMFIVPAPRPSASIMHSSRMWDGKPAAKDGKGKIGKTLADPFANSGDPAWLADLYEQAGQALTATDGFAVIHQPADTIINHLWTMETYSVGSVRLHNLQTEHPATEFRHMNAEFGQLMLQRIVAHAKEAAATPA